jgi:chaperonin GroES
MSWRAGNVEYVVDDLPHPGDGAREAWQAMQKPETPINFSGIRPTEFRVLVLPDKVEEQTKGGIIIPDEKKDRDQYAVMEATIIECSPLAFTYESNWPEGSKPKAGDRVVIAKYSGGLIKGKDSVEYKLVADKDVLAVLE